MSERERFEAWARTQPRHEGASMRFLPLNNAYIDFDLHGAWLAWQAARSGQAASGSSQGARSDEAVKRFGIKPWSTLAQLKDDEDLELYVQARIEAEGVGQPEAPTAAPLPKGWNVIRKDDPLKTLIVIAPNGYSAVTTAVSRNPENVLRMLVEAIAAHPPARSGAGSEDARDAERWRMASTSDDFGIATRGPHGVTVRYDSGAREMIDAAIAASKPPGGERG